MYNLQPLDSVHRTCSKYQSRTVSKENDCIIHRLSIASLTLPQVTKKLLPSSMVVS